METPLVILYLSHRGVNIATDEHVTRVVDLSFFNCLGNYNSAFSNKKATSNKGTI